MTKKLEQMSALFEVDSQKKQSGPVTCLGMTFENDEARRAYFTEELRRKLPELKDIDGFPIGEDEDILKLSDPPYYTACPNPWIQNFISEWNSQKKPKTVGYQYHREPFAADVSAGKNEPLYKIPSYYTKVPPKAIIPYILHYTEPGDVVLDCFAGSGMTGIATHLCGNKMVIKEQGYSIKENKVYRNGEYLSEVGERESILIDLSPYAAFTSAYMNSPYKVDKRNTSIFINEFIKKEIASLYETTWDDGVAGFDYMVWSDWSVCDECGFAYNLFNTIIDWDNKIMRKEITCANCGITISTEGLGKILEKEWDPWVGEILQTPKSSAVLMSRLVGNQADRKLPAEEDFALYDEVAQRMVRYRPQKLAYSHMTHERNNLPKYWGITHIHQFYSRRNYYALDRIVSYCREDNDYTGLFCALAIIENNATKRNRFYVDNRRPKGSPIGPLSNTLYVPGIYVETNVGKKVVDKFNELTKVKELWSKSNSIVSNQSATSLVQIPDNSIDFIFTDPPFGGNINYSEQSVLVEWWLKVFTNNKQEAITNNVQNKDVYEYQHLMTMCFQEYFRVLKPNRWMVVEFHNSSNRIWNCVQQALERAGFIVASVNLLDKKQDTLHQDYKVAAVNKDLAITVYKPLIALEKGFSELGSNEEYVWSFIGNHLDQLPIYASQGNGMAERTKYILFDRMVAFYIQKGLEVPISASDFYYGLSVRFVECEGMYFLPEQVHEFNRRKSQFGFQGQEQHLFVINERSAIEWLHKQLKYKPQTFQDIHPAFMQELKNWNKYDEPLELSMLLEQNFIQYDGEGPVPPQIHSYLSSNYKELRELDKEDIKLTSKAKNRWYVADPNKQADLEKLREKSLLREFATYVEEIKRSKKKLKQFRLEAIRTGFKKAWGDKDYKTIVEIGSKLPEVVLQEDDKLLMYYDNAQIRMGV